MICDYSVRAQQTVQGSLFQGNICLLHYTSHDLYSVINKYCTLLHANNYSTHVVTLIRDETFTGHRSNWCFVEKELNFCCLHDNR